MSVMSKKKSEEVAACGCSHSHPASVPTKPCTEGDKSPALPPPMELPWVRVARDPEHYAQVRQLADTIGPITSTEKVYDMLAPVLMKEDQEVFVVVLLDHRMLCRGIAELHRGERTKVHVATEDIMRMVLVYGAERYITVHNHPTGKAKASKKDFDLHANLVEKTKLFSRIKYEDSVVIGLDEYFSIRENKLHKKDK